MTTPDMQIPFSPALEKQLYPNRTRIADAVRAQLGVAAPVGASTTGAHPITREGSNTWHESRYCCPSGAWA